MKATKDRTRTNRLQRLTQSRRLKAMVEACEPRTLMTVAPFLQGTAFVDSNANGIYDPTESPLSGATVNLYLGNSTTPLGTVVTGSDGGYVFDNTGANGIGHANVGSLTPGATYRIVETAGGYYNTNAQVQTQVNTASVTSSNTITVTLANPNNITSTFQGPTNSTSFPEINYSTTGAGTQATYVIQLPTKLGGDPNVNTAVFQSMCVGVNDFLSTNPFTSPTVPQSALPNGGQIAYLFNRYGTTLPATSVVSTLPTSYVYNSTSYNLQTVPAKNVIAGVQIAIWELEYGSNFTVVSAGSNSTATDLAQMNAAASYFIGASAGKSEKATVLDAVANGGNPATLPTTGAPDGSQSLLATDSLNFGNAQMSSPTINTVAAAGGAVGGSGLTDTATLSGGNSPTGTITFTLTGPGNNILTTETVNVSGNGTYTTPTAIVPLQAGSYTWSATYSGDTKNASATDNGVNETLNIGKTTVAINTVASAGGTVGGQGLTDTANLSGAVNPTGSIVFTLTGPNGNVVTTETVTVTGNGTYTTPNAVIPTQAGNYVWSATYGGDANNSAITDNGANETATVSKAGPAINTIASAGGSVGSGGLTDSATLSGGYNPTGTITFTLTGPDHTVVTTETVTVTGNGTYNTPTPVLPTQVGNYVWSATYNGDTNNSTATDNGQNETSTVSQAGPAINTVASAGGSVGTGGLTDSAVLSGGYNPTGTITFTLTGPDHSVVTTETVTVTGNGTYSTPTPVLPTQVGNYVWSATYNGDTNNSTATDNGQNETTTISKAGPTINTIASAGGSVGSGGLTDSATLTGGYNPTGTITFTLTGPDHTVVTTETVTVTGNGTYSTPTPVLPTQVGNYVWSATYNGDTNNSTATDNGQNETSTVSKAGPAINTIASAGGSVGSGGLTDSATLTGGYNPTGTITFTLTGPDHSVVTTETVTVSGNGTYSTPTPVLPTQVGNYVWSATYNGDTNNSTATDNGQNETSTVSQAGPAINTIASAGGSVGSGGLTDSATLTGGYNPTGTITFTLTGPDHSVVTTETVTVSGNGTYSTPTPVLPTQVGNYVWSATYSGDTNNSTATDNGQNETSTVSQAGPAINTVASAGGSVGSGGLTDSAVLSGGYNPTGTITFTLTAPDHTVVATETVNVNGNNTYSTPTPVVPTQVGNYVWSASYSGDTNNASVTDNGVNETSTVSKAGPAINTVATAGGSVGGSGLSDTATLTGGYNPGGTITFTLTGPDHSVVTTETVAVSGNGSYTTPIPVVPSQVGNYVWSATYNGDANNSAVTDNGANETATVSKAGPAINTVAAGGGSVGSGGLTDTAVLSGGFNPTGTITFTLTAPDHTVVATETVTVNGNNTYSTPTPVLPTQVGNYVWSATYNGDSNNTGVADNGANETATVSKANPTINTVAAGGGSVGSGGLTDTATLANGYHPTGTITFTLTAPDHTVVATETVTVNGNGNYTTPNAVVPTQVGSYVWSATYNGDANNTAVTDNGQNETTSGSKANPTINTVASAGGSVGSGGLTDTATLAGGYNPTGTITFTLTGPNNVIVTTETVNVTGNGTYTTPNAVVPLQVGTYLWSATYNGDSNNSSAHDNGQNETATVSKAGPAINTVASAAIPLASSGLTDTAVLSGGYNPTGTITFRLTAPNNTVVSTQTVNVTGNGTYTTPSAYTPTMTGTYTWSATYNGDTKNSSVQDNGQNETTAVSKANPLINTVATNSSTCGGNGITDTATLSGGYSPTGTITFKLTAPNNTIVSTQTVTVNGNGVYTTPTAYTPTLAGTYTWSATYNGDTKNATAQDNGQNESVTVGKANPTINTVATTSSTCGGSGITDRATLSGGYNPTGTITFKLTAPNNTVVSTQTVTVNGNGVYTTPTAITPTMSGVYTWSATYNGDSKNSAAQDNGQNESVTVGKTSPAISTVASPGGFVNVVNLTDTATLSGGYNPTGTITFKLTAPNGTVVKTETVTVNGNGNYTTPQSVLATQAGTYTWSATYSGDNNNGKATDNGQNETSNVTQPGTISGHKYLDATGNGLQPGEAPLKGVTIRLLSDSNHTGVCDSTDQVVATTVTDANGAYSFTNVPTGTYFVQEVVPTGYIQTGPLGPAANNVYTVTVAANGTVSTGNDFADYMPDCDSSDYSNIVYKVNGVVVPDLTGYTHQGDVVSVTFNVTASTPHQFSLVSYTAPAATFSASTASQQVVFEADSELLTPGVHTLTVQIPNSYYQVDFVCGAVINTFGPAGSNVFYHQEQRFIDSDNGGTETQLLNPASLAGTVFVDTNADGVQNNGEAGLGGVTVKLTGTDQYNKAVSLTRVTDSNGNYLFDGLQPGKYTVTEVEPSGYFSTGTSIGTVNGTTDGHTSNSLSDIIDSVILSLGNDGINYNFGELQTNACVDSGATATIGFWHNNNGQALINSLNGSSSSKALGNWLASNFSNLYGSSAGSNNMTNKTNSQVAAYFLTLFNQTGTKTAAQVLATALAVYATNSTLAGGSYAASYGFTVNASGTGSRTYNVGTNGAGFGVANNTTVTVMQLLQATNSASSAGSLYSGNTTKQGYANNVFSGINQSGDITS